MNIKKIKIVGYFAALTKQQQDNLFNSLCSRRTKPRRHAISNLGQLSLAIP